MNIRSKMVLLVYKLILSRGLLSHLAVVGSFSSGASFGGASSAGASSAASFSAGASSPSSWPSPCPNSSLISAPAYLAHLTASVVSSIASDAWFAAVSSAPLRPPSA